jgi:hypothetical protein
MIGELNEAQRANLPLELPPDAERDTSRRRPFSPPDPWDFGPIGSTLARAESLSPLLPGCGPTAAQCLTLSSSPRAAATRVATATRTRWPAPPDPSGGLCRTLSGFPGTGRRDRDRSAGRSNAQLSCG